MRLTSWPEDGFVGLTSVLKRLYDLCPSQNIQIHLLHLASRGFILPHIDNTDASGSWILGVSLGAQRLLRLESRDNALSELLLPSGSVYLQRYSSHDSLYLPLRLLSVATSAIPIGIQSSIHPTAIVANASASWSE